MKMKSLDECDILNYNSDMSKLSRYSLEDLVSATDLSARTIRNYIAMDLLPGPEALGRNAWYSDLHLNRLKCLQRLRSTTGLPLSDLGPVLNMLSDEQIIDIASGREQITAIPVGQNTRTRGETPVSIRHKAANQYSASQASSHIDSRSDKPVEIIRAGKKGRASRLGELVKALETIAGDTVPRSQKNGWWATVPITRDIELRARGLDDDGIAELEQLADLLRHLLQKGVDKTEVTK
ncbi:MAG: DNA-binding transcriptional MerR regulator [Gammaproteobacteria bacterium]|jgi:DNA-binding transcriptional MerR regulator